MQSLADAVIIIDQRGVIQSFSPAAEKTFGYQADEVVGGNVSVLMPSPDREEHDRYLREYVEAGWTSSSREHQMLTGDAQIVRPQRETIALRKDGTRFPIRLLVSEVDTGKERFFIGLLSDITEQVQAREELRVAKEKAEEAHAIIEAQ
ncbi:MAG TPA: PAS domain S-box protein, partial [Rhodothermia bacterium]|nr:PAS domain S-box protein [Rhodothermia bacterium]